MDEESWRRKNERRSRRRQLGVVIAETRLPDHSLSEGTGTPKRHLCLATLAPQDHCAKVWPVPAASNINFIGKLVNHISKSL